MTRHVLPARRCVVCRRVIRRNGMRQVVLMDDRPTPRIRFAHPGCKARLMDIAGEKQALIAYRRKDT